MNAENTVGIVYTAVCGLVLSCGVSATAQAALIGVLPSTAGGTDYQAYYDDHANLTWLADADANGATSWSEANAWAWHLDIDGVTGWRLPTTAQPDASCSQQFGGISYGLNCTVSEMGRLFYDVLGGSANRSIDAVNNANTDQFSNIFPDYYWSATPYTAAAGDAWLFDFGTGYQDFTAADSSLHAWAVHSGNVAAPVSPVSPVPEPGSGWLFAFALAWLPIALRRCRSHRSPG